MPCNDGGVPYPPSREEDLQNKMPAVLCALLRQNGFQFVADHIDWADDVGVTKAEMQEWAILHEKRDIKRRELDARRRHDETLRREIEAKLTPDDLALIRRLFP